MSVDVEVTASAPPRVRRLAEELSEVGFVVPGPADVQAAVLTELDYALHPRVHERRVPTYGALVAPSVPASDWQPTTDLSVTSRKVPTGGIDGARLFADGLSSWVVRGPVHRAGPSAGDELVVFDRPAGSERDLVLLAEATGATVVQRHPMGVVRVAGAFGVLRFDGIGWQQQPPVSSWIDSLAACAAHGDRDVLETLLELAVHDLGARGIGAILVYRPEPVLDDPSWERRLARPPGLRVVRPADLAPLVHVLTQIDGAAVFDADGTLQELGVRLLPSPLAEESVDGLRGMRHTNARRYSFDDPLATVIVVSEDGPVTVLRGGEIQGGTA